MEELHALEECAQQLTRTRPTTDAIRHGTPLSEPVATARSSREPLPCHQRSLSNEQASEQASGVIRAVKAALGYTQ